MITRSAQIEGMLESLSEMSILVSLGKRPASNSWTLNDDLSAWFHQDTLGQLVDIWSLRTVCGTEHDQAVFDLLFTSVLFQCAASGTTTRSGKRRRRHWGWIADNVKPKHLDWRDAFSLWKEQLTRAQDVMARVPKAGIGQVETFTADILSKPSKASFADAVISSPPYLGMIDYALANRLTYMWMGWDLHEDLRVEIGARRRRDRRTGRQEYLESMRIAGERLYHGLRPKGFCALVLGGPRRDPEVALHVFEVVKEYMQIAWGPTPRVPSRRRVGDRSGREPTEWVVVFQKES